MFSTAKAEAQKISKQAHQSYYDLLPQSNVTSGLLDPPSATDATTNHESAANAFIKSARSSPNISAFAEDLRAQVSVPNKIYHLRRSASARAVMRKTTDQNWTVDIFGPDAYARSILLEAITSLPVNSYGFLKLNRSDWRRVEIAFSFEWRNHDFAQAQLPESDISIKENQIKIAVIHSGSELELNTTLRRAMLVAPLPGGRGIVDIAGIYKEFVKAREPAPGQDRDIRRLERSPAFMKRLITIPIGQ